MTPPDVNPRQHFVDQTIAFQELTWRQRFGVTGAQEVWRWGHRLRGLSWGGLKKRLKEFIFAPEFGDGRWWKHWTVKWTWASVTGLPSSLPPVLLLQSENFSLNRIVSSYSETHPSSAQLGRPSPLLKTQWRPDINQQLYRKPTLKYFLNQYWLIYAHCAMISNCLWCVSPS